MRRRIDKVCDIPNGALERTSTLLCHADDERLEITKRMNQFLSCDAKVKKDASLRVRVLFMCEKNRRARRTENNRKWKPE